jgi:hypothetical protein
MQLIKIYLVKSINLNNTGEDATTNLRLFQNRDKAEEFKRTVEKQINRNVYDINTYEYVAIEEFTVELKLEETI